MEGYWGMGRSIASHGVTHRVGIGGGGQPGMGEKTKERDLLKSTLAARIEAKLNDLSERTEKLIRENRHEILAVTHALETNKTLTGDDIEAVIVGKQGPLIDGRPYHTTEFEREAEQYHDEVLEAHARHGSVDVPLPELNGRREAGPSIPAAAAKRPRPGNGGAVRKAAVKKTTARNGAGLKKSTTPKRPPPKRR
jgi:hypothetical protein